METAVARERFDIVVGQNVHVMSDKQFQSTKKDTFEAVGNVVITHGHKALYGEKATMNLKTGECNIVGNVRFVGSEMTIYGTELLYNLKTQYISVKNARAMTGDFIVLGKELTRLLDGSLYGEEAEYTTCRDCPESWAVYGKKVYINLGDYIRIQHAFIKIKGVVVMYVPYVVLPIKKNRETGLLFPSFGVSLSDGARYQQPWFWAIAQNSDMTLTPSIWGKRGAGAEAQYRYVLGDRKWMEVNSVGSWDRIYLPNRFSEEISGDHYLRYFADYEHHFAIGNNITHHLYYNNLRDLDVIRDYSSFISSRVSSSDVGGGTFLDMRTNLIDVNFEAYFNKNQLIDDAMAFDHSYVQILPKVSFNSVPFSFLRTDLFMLQDISLGLSGDFTAFKQNHLLENQFIRNAHRVNAAPFIDWNLGRVGPVQLKTNAALDYQYYRFPYEEEKSFSKQGIKYESEITFGIEKIFGMAYRDEIPLNQVKYISKKNEEKYVVEFNEEPIIGKVPIFKNRYVKDKISVISNSYRHGQQFKIKHYYLSNQKVSGNNDFYQQIQRNDGSGIFDYLDSIREKEHEYTDTASLTQLPVSNTVELQWNNIIIKKSPKYFDPFNNHRFLRDNFSYGNIGHFNVSQGYDFHTQGVEGEEKSWKDSITRLFVNAGYSFPKTSISATEYYFYKTKSHILSLAVSQAYSYFDLGTSFQYNSVHDPVKTIGVTATVRPLTDLVQLRTEYNYDIANSQTSNSKYTVIYSPSNKCWMLEVGHQTTLTDKRFSFNFLINYNKNQFTSFSEM